MGENGFNLHHTAEETEALRWLNTEVGGKLDSRTQGLRARAPPADRAVTLALMALKVSVLAPPRGHQLIPSRSAFLSTLLGGISNKGHHRLSKL